MSSKCEKLGIVVIIFALYAVYIAELQNQQTLQVSRSYVKYVETPPCTINNPVDKFLSLLHNDGIGLDWNKLVAEMDYKVITVNVNVTSKHLTYTPLPFNSLDLTFDNITLNWRTEANAYGNVAGTLTINLPEMIDDTLVCMRCELEKDHVKYDLRFPSFNCMFMFETKIGTTNQLYKNILQELKNTHSYTVNHTGYRTDTLYGLIGRPLNDNLESCCCS